MSKQGSRNRVPAAARAFRSLQAEDALLPGEASLSRKSGAIALALLVLAAFPLYLAASATGVIGDTPAALAKSSNSGPGSGEDDDSSGPGGSGDDDDTGTHTRTGTARTDNTSRDGHSTRGTTNDNDTRTHRGTNDTSRNGHSTRGTTDDNDTRTGTGTGGQTWTRTGGS